jgi:mono/diheme cytochrome c family protein
LRWARRAIGAIALLAVLTVAYVYVASERILRRTYTVPLSPITLPGDSAALIEGERLARVRGCFGGCHGMRSEGQVFFDDPKIARLVAPNLTDAAARWSDAELARIIRHGVRPNGRSVFSMPAHTFTRLSDEDLGAILAFLRHTPREPGLQAELQVRWMGRLGLVLGQYRPEAELIAHDSIPPTATPREPLAHGQYLARTICTECHGIDLRGTPGSTPDLIIVRGYSAEAFTHLLCDGVPVSQRQLRLMGDMSRKRFSHLTEVEIADLYQYLSSLKPPS